MAAIAPASTAVLERVTAYADDVVAGRILAGQLVRHAAARHMTDALTGDARGLAWDEDAASHAIQFIEQLRHSKGEWAGDRFILEPWQVFIVGSVFGWYRADGTRRFRRLYLEVARKNGKTTLAAALALYLAFADGEAGAEVYAVATKRDQAKICWEEAQRMVRQTPALGRVITISRGNLARLDTFSKFEPLGRDADTSSGLNPHGAVIDEIHEHTSREMIDIIDTAIGARRQPLVIETTTAGTEDSRVWADERAYAVLVLEGATENDALFAYVAGIDKGDDWRDEAVYVKANPNLGVSVQPATLTAKRDEAIAQPSKQNAFRRLHLNQITEQAERWIDMSQWDGCAGVPHLEPGQAVYVGLDMSSKIDLSAAVMLAGNDAGGIDIAARFWRPEDGVYEAEARDGVPYRLWAEQGYLTLVEGSMVDPAAVADDVVDWLAGYDVASLAFDTWNAASAAARLEQAGIPITGLTQGYATYTEPCHHLEALLSSGLVRHGGNPVLRWMAAQMVVKFGPNDSIRPWKPHGSGLRNDGIVALLMALSRSLLHEQDAGSGPVFWDFGDAS